MKIEPSAQRPPYITEAFNHHFANIGHNLASELSEIGVDRLSYLKPVENKFLFTNIGVQTVHKLIWMTAKKKKKKTTGLDRIPCKLLKIAADILAPSLTETFNQWISVGFFPDGMEISNSNTRYKITQIWIIIAQFICFSIVEKKIRKNCIWPIIYIS